MVLFQIHFGSGAAQIRIRHDFPGSDSFFKFWIWSDPDPQQCVQPLYMEAKQNNKQNKNYEHDNKFS